MVTILDEKVIPGLPETAEEAISQIEEVECSSPSEWLSLESVLDKIESPHRNDCRLIAERG